MFYFPKESSKMRKTTKETETSASSVLVKNWCSDVKYMNMSNTTIISKYTTIYYEEKILLLIF